MKTLLSFVLLAALAAMGGCTREDGLPDPPLQTLVPCVHEAGSPIACPEQDAAVAVDAGAD